MWFNLNNISKIYTSAGDFDSNAQFHFNKSALIYNLILFDETIIHTANYRDIDQMIGLMGVSCVMDLLDSGAVRIDNSISSIAGYDLKSIANKSWIHLEPVTIRSASIHDKCEKELNKLRIKHSIPKKIYLQFENKMHKSFIEASDRRFSDSLRFCRQEFIRQDGILLKNYLASKVDEYEISKFDEIELKVSPIGDRILIESNVCSISKMSPTELFDLGQNFFLNLSRPFTAAELSKEMDAVITMSEKESEQIEGSIINLLQGQDRGNIHGNLTRILDVAKLPSFEENFSSIKFDQIYKLRQLDEILEFREWVSKSQNMSDEEIQRMFNSVKARISEVWSCPIGKIGRIAIASGFGPAAGVGWALAESFILDQLFKRHSIIAFINDELSTILPIYVPDKE